MKNISILLILTSMFLTSCSYYAYQFQTGSTPQSETIPESIKIYSGDIEQDYIVIGSVSADVVGGSDTVVKYLKKKASKLGADAIINVNLSKFNTFSNRTGISGVAVKLK